MAGGRKRGDAELPRLLVPLDLAGPELEKLIREGSYLRGDAGMYDRRVPATPRNEAKRHEQWERLIAEAESWFRHTQRLLRSWFSDDEMALEFASPVEKGWTSYTGLADTPEGERQLVEHLNHQVGILETLLRRLGSYAIPVPEVSSSRSSEERPQLAAPSYITYDFRGGTFGQLIAGEGQRVNNINSHIAAVMGQGEPQVGAALQRLAEVTLSDPELDQQTRTEVLETIEDLAEAAEAQPEQRKTGRIKGAIAVIGSAAGAAAQLGEAWRQWGPVITDHLRLPSG